jgi:hypothetical protein
MDEVWWIYSRQFGLHMAIFSTAASEAGERVPIVFIQGEVDRRRIGPRFWSDIQEREGWVKVTQITMPSEDEVEAAIERRLHEIGKEIADEVIGRKPPC